MTPAETAVRTIISQYGPPQTESPSSLLQAVRTLPPDRHDVAGALHIAREAFEKSDHDDPYRATLGKVLAFERSDKRYDRHDIDGILTLCNEGIAAIAAAPAASAPRP